MSDTPSQSETAREAAREASEPSSWAARQATRLSGDGPLPGAEALSQVRRGILCVKCERLNELDAEKCAKCSSHLHVFCHRCGAKNPRVQSRCEKCKKRLCYQGLRHAPFGYIHSYIHHPAPASCVRTDASFRPHAEQMPPHGVSAWNFTQGGESDRSANGSHCRG